MTNRREFLGTAGWLAMGAAAGMPALARESAAAPTWAPYRKSYAIDGLSGPDLLYFAEDDPMYADALKAVRECGLTSVMTTAGPQGRFWYTNEQFAETKQRIADWNAKIDKHADLMMLVRNRADLEKTRRERKLGVIYTFQGAEPLGEDLDRVTLFRDMGLRVLQLTHNRRNLVGDGCMEPGNAGLSKLGNALVERLNAEKIVVDLAHGAQRTIREGILASKKPMLISHSGCRALAPEAPRLVYDDELKLLADRGGVVGIIFWPYIRSQGQQVAADVIRHIEHAVKVCGEDHVGIGTDLGTTPAKITPEFEKENLEMIKDMIEQGIFEKRDPKLYLFPPDLNVANRFEVLAGMLSARGFPDARIEKILGGNFARVMGEVWG
ncbi:dipeptidase [Tahibacter soli]|uniref:Dipeptidase n=1 Tax=Tahibacter soli TaxID=2983605 RepID=A0A9X4BLM8_9GAMM|nr:dipeptidase [Tahibacter soli]MDC8014429.1 dipeptidase [Tahibacter soli]